MAWRHRVGLWEFWSNGKCWAEVYKTSAGDWGWSAQGRRSRQGVEETLRDAKRAVAVVLAGRHGLEAADARKLLKAAVLRVLAGE